jgi:uncharacterized protein YigE (DUF2233 family)
MDLRRFARAVLTLDRRARGRIGALLLAWLGPGLAHAADAPCRGASFEGAGFTVCAYRRGEQQIRLESAVDGKPIGSFAALRRVLGKAATGVDFAMNAGMYDVDQRPIGLFVRHGVTEHPLNRTSDLGNFYLKPNGVFWVGQDGDPHVEATDVYAEAPRYPDWATQSGPLLVWRGAFNAHISPNGTSLQVRNAVGVRGREAVFVISDAPVSFGRLARFLRDGLGCPDALYLDGSVSALWAPGLRREDRATQLGTFLVVSRSSGRK